MEVWKDIKNYEGLYQISNLGNVRNIRTNRNMAFTKSTKKRNYYKVLLSKQNQRKSYSVHRLVAEHFIPNPNNYPCVNHKNQNTFDNTIDNLEWCTYEYNNKYGTTDVKRKLVSIINYLEMNYKSETEAITMAKELYNKIIKINS